MNDHSTETKTPAAPERAPAEAAAAREAFFAAIPDPPEHSIVAAQAAAADEGDAADEAPKSSSTPASARGEKSKKPPRGSATDAADTSPKNSSDESKPSENEGDLVSRVREALKKGDVDTLADLIDQDPAAFDEKSTKWAARNRKESKLKDEVAKVKADAAAIVEHYEPIDSRVARFSETRDYGVIAELVEILTGEDFDSVGMKVFRARRTQDPRVPELQKKLQEREAEVVEARTAKEKAADRALREALRDDLPEDHLVRKLPEWEDRVARVLRDSVDDDTGEPTLSFRQAAQRVVRKEKEEYEKRAAVFGGDVPAKTGRTRAETPERAAAPTGAGKRKLTPDEFFAQYGK